jgi:hypothetical protein
MVTKIQAMVFWIVTPSGNEVGYQCFGGDMTRRPQLGSLTCSQELATGPYPQPKESSKDSSKLYP